MHLLCLLIFFMKFVTRRSREYNHPTRRSFLYLQKCFASERQVDELYLQQYTNQTNKTFKLIKHFSTNIFPILRKLS